MRRAPSIHEQVAIRALSSRFLSLPQFPLSAYLPSYLSFGPFLRVQCTNRCPEGSLVPLALAWFAFAKSYGSYDRNLQAERIAIGGEETENEATVASQERYLDKLA